MEKRKTARGKMPDIELVDLRGLDDTLAKIIATYLKEFREVVSLSGATPGEFVLRNGGDSMKAWKEWSGAIDRMIYAFEKYHEHYTDCNETAEEKEAIKTGMQFFIDYFNYLNY